MNSSDFFLPKFLTFFIYIACFDIYNIFPVPGRNNFCYCIQNDPLDAAYERKNTDIFLVIKLP